MFAYVRRSLLASPLTLLLAIAPAMAQESAEANASSDTPANPTVQPADADSPEAPAAKAQPSRVDATPDPDKTDTAKTDTAKTDSEKAGAGERENDTQPDGESAAQPAPAADPSGDLEKSADEPQAPAGDPSAPPAAEPEKADADSEDQAAEQRGQAGDKLENEEGDWNVPLPEGANLESLQPDEVRDAEPALELTPPEANAPQPAEPEQPQPEQPQPREPEAQPRNRAKLAITRWEEAGDEFAWQGEYQGEAWVPGYGLRRLGLQVVSLGDGQFEVVEYAGGLPGSGWNRVTRRRFPGELQGGTLVTGDDTLTWVITPSRADLYDRRNRLLGQLEKLQRYSPTLGAPAPSEAIVLFDGSEPKLLEGAELTEDGLLMPGTTTRLPVGDFRLHLEFRTPYMPFARGQGRGNSGVYIQQRYEVQVLDSFGQEGAANECGGLYKQRPPALNMCLPPLAWQTYDIWFTAARWDATGNKLTDARLTVQHNGITIHDDVTVPAKTGNGKPEGPEQLPILLQFHGDPVRYRNVWIIAWPTRTVAR